jgi:hydrogenase maturation protease
MRIADRILFAGIGSPHGDDRAGWLVSDALAADPLPGVVVRKASVPIALLDWLDGVTFLGICDACRGEGPVGSIQRIEWNSAATSTLARLRACGTHAFGLSAVLNLAHRLDRLPPRVVVWGIEGQQFQPGDNLSPSLAERLPEIAATIRKELCRLNENTPGPIARTGGA